MNFLGRFYLYFLVFGYVSMVLLNGCNRNYYAAVEPAREVSESNYLILKSGEKIDITDAEISGKGRLGKITGESRKDFNNDDIVVVQNKKGYYKRFDFDGQVAAKKLIYPDNMHLVKKGVFWDKTRFIERDINGAINVYTYTESQLDFDRGGQHTTFATVKVWGLGETNDLIFDGGHHTEENSLKIKQWVRRSAAAKKIINDWIEFGGKKAYKMNGIKANKDIYMEVVTKYNEDALTGNLIKE
jgi:hypothetical protein